MSTEEDGVDEAGRTRQSPLIMAPPVSEADPDEVADDTVAGNGIMSPSWTRTGNSSSSLEQQSNGASDTDGSTGSHGDSAGSFPAAAEELPEAKETTESWLDTAAPLPADAMSEAEVRLSSGEATDEGQGSGPQGGEQEMTSGESDKSAGKAARAGDTGWASGTEASRSWATPASYGRSEWSTGLDSSESAPDDAEPVTRNDYQSSSKLSSGAAVAASAASGVAAGMVNSVASAWQKRGAAGPKGFQARKPSKRQAMLTLSRVEPWSVMKFSFVASVVAFVILFIAVAVLYMVLAALGVFDSIQNTVTTMTSSQGSTGTNISHWFSASLILGYTAMLGALNIVLITAMSTVGSVVYNLIAKAFGGIEVTLRETD